MRRGGSIGAVILLILATGTALGAVTGSPSLSAFLADDALAPGEVTTLDVVLLNDGDVDSGSATNPSLNGEVTTARGVTVAVADGSAPLEVQTGRQAVGTVGEGVTEPIPFEVVVPPDAEPGRYRVAVDVAYRYTEFISEDSGFHRQESVEETFRVPVVIRERARFAIESVRTNVTDETAGTVRLTVTNEGRTSARDVRFSLSASSPHLSVDGAETSTSVVDRLDSGESVTLEYRVAPSPGASPTNYSLRLTAEYEDPAGQTYAATPRWFDVRLSAGLDATFSTTDASLPAGTEDSVEGTVTLRGAGRAGNAVVVVSTPPGDVRVAETRIPVGDLASGETAAFSVPVTVPPGVRSGPRSMTLGLEYRDPDRPATRRSVGSSVVEVDVTDPERVSLRAINATVNPDAESRLAVEIENVGERTLHDVQAGMVPRPPFSSVSPTGYVPELPPGEAARVAFHVSVAEEAVVGSTSIPLNVTAETADGRPIATGSHLVVVEVVEPEGATSQTTVLVAGVVVVAVALGLGWWWLHR